MDLISAGVGSGTVTPTGKTGIVLSPKPKSKNTKREVATKQVGIRATTEWAAWLERAAAYCRTDMAKMIDAALIDYRKAKGFDEPPPIRI